jgi:DtxR family transcriptional regulator, Mn-dependent transcriptional regulator
MASPTVENYLKAAFEISVTEGARRATTGRLATVMKVSPGTVTSMLKTLGQSGLATYTPYEGVRLTESGMAMALRTIRCHRLLELFLCKSLNLTWDQVHDDAENMEHAVSDALMDRIDEYLDHPEFDPHGDPIPTREGQMPQRHSRSLITCRNGFQFQLVRVTEQSSEFLRYLTESGLTLGVMGEVVANQPEAGLITVRAGEREVTMSEEAAQSLFVVEIAGEKS